MLLCGLLAITTAHPAALPSGGAAPKPYLAVPTLPPEASRQRRGIISTESYLAAQTSSPISRQRRAAQTTTYSYE